MCSSDLYSWFRVALILHVDVESTITLASDVWRNGPFSCNLLAKFALFLVEETSVLPLLVMPRHLEEKGASQASAGNSLRICCVSNGTQRLQFVCRGQWGKWPRHTSWGRGSWKKSKRRKDHSICKSFDKVLMPKICIDMRKWWDFSTELYSPLTGPISTNLSLCDNADNPIIQSVMWGWPPPLPGQPIQSTCDTLLGGFL